MWILIYINFIMDSSTTAKFLQKKLNIYKIINLNL